MIQEAHVGVGISGLEGQQAVNASDFSIAQFRFLQDLVLVHGRWNFLRMAKVVLFSFYKNAVMAGTMIAFGQQCLFSGTPLYDMWVISMLNFVAGIPILFLGVFDRDLDRDYVKRNPIVYKSSQNNEHLTLRVSLRWVCLIFVHVFTLYYLNQKPLALGGGVTSAFAGLMHNAERDWPGDGEGGDLKVYGLTIFSALIITLAYKVLYESRSIINGVWPACTCRKDIGQGWPNRLAWTWVGVLWGSIGFFFFAMYTYQLVGRNGASSMSPFVMAANHTYNMRSITWMLLILVPTAACVFDVVGKVFGNMYYPTQTQIHCEIQAEEVAKQKTSREARSN
jgi:magnesium-transporting ATPase (P-type)